MLERTLWYAKVEGDYQEAQKEQMGLLDGMKSVAAIVGMKRQKEGV
jgi:hypothetical protein